MSQLLKQARNLLLTAGLLVSLSAQGVWAAVPAETMGPNGAGGDKTVSVGQWFSNLLSSTGTESAKPEDGKKAAEVKASGPADLEAIKAKHYDQDPADKADEAKKKEEASNPPYKVYPSPTLLDDSPNYVDPYEATRGQQAPSSPTAFSGWSQRSAATVDTKSPPPLPEAMQRVLSGADKPVQLPERTRSLAPVTVPSKPGAVPPISALPKQFFPVLPAAALPDTVPQLLPVASNQPLEADHANVTRAIIVIHDIQRNAAEGVATLMTLSGVDGDRTLIIAPQFPLELDILRFGSYLPNEGKFVTRWPIAQGWQSGGDTIPAGSRTGVSSFTALDLLLMFLNDQRRFPSLERVVFVGHGLGADFLQRYAAMGQALPFVEKKGLDVRFLIANPSSYLYFTKQRPAGGGPSFADANVPDCPKLNTYPYGLENLNAYARRVGENEIRLRYPDQKMVFLVGDKITNDTYLDASCAANAQGADRLTRGKNYARYLSHVFGAEVEPNQMFVFVPRAGYDAVSVYGSSCGMDVLFGPGYCVSGE